jgi:putative intracellular protease/amidase
MKIAYVLYPDFTALDLVGPYEIISRWPEADVHFLARTLDRRGRGVAGRRSLPPCSHGRRRRACRSNENVGSARSANLRVAERSR